MIAENVRIINPEVKYLFFQEMKSLAVSVHDSAEQITVARWRQDNGIGPSVNRTTDAFHGFAPGRHHRETGQCIPKEFNNFTGPGTSGDMEDINSCIYPFTKVDM